MEPTTPFDDTEDGDPLRGCGAFLACIVVSVIGWIALGVSFL